MNVLLNGIHFQNMFHHRKSSIAYSSMNDIVLRHPFERNLFVNTLFSFVYDCSIHFLILIQWFTWFIVIATSSDGLHVRCQ